MIWLSEKRNHPITWSKPSSDWTNNILDWSILNRQAVRKRYQISKCAVKDITINITIVIRIIPLPRLPASSTLASLWSLALQTSPSWQTKNIFRPGLRTPQASEGKKLSFRFSQRTAQSLGECAVLDIIANKDKIPGTDQRSVKCEIESTDGCPFKVGTHTKRIEAKPQKYNIRFDHFKGHDLGKDNLIHLMHVNWYLLSKTI